MSNPAVFLLSSTQIHGEIIRFEDNLGESIHIHAGLLRISLTINEFTEFVDCLLDAARQLFKENNLDFDTIDVNALDWDWLENFSKIRSVSVQNVPVGELYTVKTILNYFGKPGILAVVPINKGRIVQALQGKTKELVEYPQINRYGQTNLERLKNMELFISNNEYPFDGKFIITNQNNRIYDGDHRAGCIYHIYGSHKVIPVLKIDFANEVSLKKLLFKQHLQILIYIAKLLKCMPGAMLRRTKNYIAKSVRRPPDGSQKLPPEFYAGKDTNSYIIHFMKNHNIDFFHIGNNIKKDGTVIADTGFIIEPKGFSIIKEYWHPYMTDKPPYDGIDFLYSVSAPIYLRFGTSHVLIYECLCCKSVFANAMIPLDKYVMKQAWKNRVWNPDMDCYEIDPKTKIIYTIVQCMCEKRQFDKDDIYLLHKNKSILNEQGFREMTTKEFFSYSSFLITCLLNDEYDKCLNKSFPIYR
ncbi:MAG TPA: hypothetical protein DCR27_05025, partial [Lachnospiraceae bacterium]|nr:hypothetical protein [Lachnospiraceae bacterium]